MRRVRPGGRAFRRPCSWASPSAVWRAGRRRDDGQRGMTSPATSARGVTRPSMATPRPRPSRRASASRTRWKSAGFAHGRCGHAAARASGRRPGQERPDGLRRRMGLRHLLRTADLLEQAGAITSQITPAGESGLAETESAPRRCRTGNPPLHGAGRGRPSFLAARRCYPGQVGRVGASAMRQGQGGQEGVELGGRRRIEGWSGPSEARDMRLVRASRARSVAGSEPRAKPNCATAVPASGTARTGR